jgi:hypothetical protein
MTMSSAVPSKSTGTFIAKRVVSFMREIGLEHVDVIAKSDQEPAINALLLEVGRVRAANSSGRYIVEQSPVGSSQSNGIAERAILSVQQQVRVLKCALETRWKVDIHSKHPVMPWLIEYASYLLNRFEVGRDGRTSYERCKGKPSKTLGFEFGESVLWRRKPISGALGKLSSLWSEGIYLGVRGSSGELIVGDKAGVWKARTLQRKPFDERWRSESAECVIGVPWRTCEDDPDVDGEPLKVVVALRLDDSQAAHTTQQAEQAVPMRFAIRREDLETHGYSARCPGCSSILRGTTKQTHSEPCRLRLAQAMKEEEKVKRSAARTSDFVEKTLEREEGARAKRARETDDKNAQDSPDASNSMHADTPGPLRTPVRNMQNPMSDVHSAPAIDINLNDSDVHHSASNSSGLTDEDRRRHREDDENALLTANRQRLADPRGEKRSLDESTLLTMEQQHEAMMRRRLEQLSRGEKRDLEDRGSEGAFKKTFVGELEVMQEDDEQFQDIEPEYFEEGQFFDELSGEELDPKKSIEARLEELTFMKNIPLYDEKDVDECWRVTGKAPISTKWVGKKKGAEVRMRLVARDFKPRGERMRGDLFAATPPLEAKKMIFRMAVGKPPIIYQGRRQKMKLRFIDISKAHLNGVLEPGEDVFICLPDEAGVPGKCGKLRRWLYGMRQAASAWERHYAQKLESIGFVRGISAATVFYNPTTQVRIVVHGDDFTLLGYEIDLDAVTKEMRSWYTLKVRATLGGEPGDDEEVTILNRLVRWVGDKLTYEADHKHAQLVTQEAGLEPDSKGLTCPIVKVTVDDAQNEGEPLDPRGATQYRATGARANFLSQDRPDIQFAAKEACRDMSAPKVASQAKLKRLARYLVEFPRLVWQFGEWEVQPDNLVTYSDSDWAGCVKTRRSTSGGVATLGDCGIKTWSSTQSVAGLSSGEAEYYALVKAAAESIGIQALAHDLGWTFGIVIMVDATAAQGIAARTGLGRVRHMETRVLWVQQAVKEGRFRICKIPGKSNPADILTKPLSAEVMKPALQMMGAHLRQRDRAEDAVGGVSAGRTCGKTKLQTVVASSVVCIDQTVVASNGQSAVSIDQTVVASSIDQTVVASSGQSAVCIDQTVVASRSQPVVRRVRWADLDDS